MISINNLVFAIEPKNSPICRFMAEFEDDPVELFYVAFDPFEKHYICFGISLEAAEDIYNGRALWHCPD